MHARIDTYRDIFKHGKQPLVAEAGLLGLLEREALEGKPWARFRIETNLGAIACALGREKDGATRFETAYSVRPDDGQAIANLALARLIQGHPSEAMQLAVRALDATPRADHAVGYLLQAAARADWDGDPVTLIPADLIGSEAADLGLAEFLRRRESPDWASRCLELCDRHADAGDFRAIGATAILSLALEAGAIVGGPQSHATVEQLNSSADYMKELADHRLAIHFADDRDLLANLNNGALLLRLCGRHAECEALLERGARLVAADPQLRRLLALAQAATGRRGEALKTLQDDLDLENRLIAAEFTALEDPHEALRRVLEIEPIGLEPRLAQLRFGLMGEIALLLGEAEQLGQAVAGLRALDPNDISASLLEARSALSSEANPDAAKDQLRAVARAVPSGLSLQERFIVADTMRNEGLPDEAVSLLASHVDVTRPGPATTLYLQSLAAARHDDTFRKALSAASDAVRGDPDILWTAAAHAWNVGDLLAAQRSVEILLDKEPQHGRARLLKIEVFLRQNKSDEVLLELDQRLEDLAWTRLNDRFRVALLLGHFGYVERAAAFAYRLFLENRDKRRAWMTLSSLVLLEGMGEPEQPRHWDVSAVGSDVAVDLKYDDGEERFFIVESNAGLRKVDDDALEPDHQLVCDLTGHEAGARFRDSHTGREGVVAQLRHKYVARLHYVLKHYESRFPGMDGFHGIHVDFEQPDGLNELIAELKAKREWTQQEQEQYCNGTASLAVLAHRLGLDTVEVAHGLAAQGIPLKVAVGNVAERDTAVDAIESNASRGCVLDLWAYWTVCRLDVLEAVTATCGPIHMTQSVLDRLYARRERLDLARRGGGLRTATYVDGKIAVAEVPQDVVATWIEELDRKIDWASDHATIVPLVAGDGLPQALRDHLRTTRADVLDATIAAIQERLLLVTDDLPIRQIAEGLGARATWSHQALMVATRDKRVDEDRFVKLTADLSSAGHSYLSVTAQALLSALRLDTESGSAPGYLFDMLSKSIGGVQADPHSHIDVAGQVLRKLWTDRSAVEYRALVTGHLLTRFVRGRQKDYQGMLRRLALDVQNIPALVSYIVGWAQGHMTPIV